MQLHATFIEAM